jgi:hypothetical protein
MARPSAPCAARSQHETRPTSHLKPLRRVPRLRGCRRAPVHALVSGLPSGIGSASRPQSQLQPVIRWGRRDRQGLGGSSGGTRMACHPPAYLCLQQVRGIMNPCSTGFRWRPGGPGHTGGQAGQAPQQDFWWPSSAHNLYSVMQPESTKNQKVNETPTTAIRSWAASRELDARDGPPGLHGEDARMPAATAHVSQT